MKQKIANPSRVLFVLAILFLGCARQFQPLALETRSFSQSNEVDRIVVAYDTFDILAVSNNNRYVKRARKKKVWFVPVKITNTGSTPATVQPTDIKAFAGQTLVVTKPAISYQRAFNQVTWPYLLFAIGDFTAARSGRDFDLQYRFFFPAFTAWGVTNFVIALKANQHFKKTLQHYTRLPTTLAPGQTVYHLMAIPNEVKLEDLYIRYVHE